MRSVHALGLSITLLTSAVLAQSGGDAKEWPKTDFSRRTEELAEIQSGGAPKDGIPAIDRPNSEIWRPR